jgi:hypothetical protein
MYERSFFKLEPKHFVVFKELTFFRDSPDIRPDDPVFFDIQYPAGYRIWLAGYPAG